VLLVSSLRLLPLAIVAVWIAMWSMTNAALVDGERHAPTRPPAAPALLAKPHAPPRCIAMSRTCASSSPTLPRLEEGGGDPEPELVSERVTTFVGAPNPRFGVDGAPGATVLISQA
jgi:hypothetical protein